MLVALAAIEAEVTSLQHRYADEPALDGPLDRILGRLDALVDSIYRMGADAAAARPATGPDRRSSAFTTTYLPPVHAVTAVERADDHEDREDREDRDDRDLTSAGNRDGHGVASDAGHPTSRHP